MEDRKTVFDYLTQVMVIFGSTIIMLNVFCRLFGEDAQEISSLFRLGSKGLSVETIFQFLGLAALIVVFRTLFFTDYIIKQMSVLLRTVCMLLADVAVIVVFSAVLGWFPMNRWEPWAMFFLCFGVSFLVSTQIMVLKEKTENRRMEEALRKLKQGKEKNL